MPIFESDEELSDKEMKRQQRALTDKMFRLESKRFMEGLVEHSNGDCWEAENDTDSE